MRPALPECRTLRQNNTIEKPPTTTRSKQSQRAGKAATGYALRGFVQALTDWESTEAVPANLLYSASARRIPRARVFIDFVTELFGDLDRTRGGHVVGTFTAPAPGGDLVTIASLADASHPSADLTEFPRRGGI